jgi:SsrA-binding protein
MADRKKNKSGDGGEAREPVVENRKARFDYAIAETLECGLKLVGTEVKSLRQGQASLAEGWVLAQIEPPQLTLMNVTIAEYPPAGANRQHDPIRQRRLLAHGREILKFAAEAKAKGATLVPLKIYWVKGRAKLLIGIGHGKKQHDKRESIAKREDTRDMERAMRKRG